MTMIRTFCALILLAGLPLMAAGGRTNNVSVTQYDNVLPHLADGNGWSSRITLVNMDTKEATLTLWFYHEDGSPWSLALKGQSVTASTFTVTLPVGGSLFLETTGTSQTTDVGWAYMDCGVYWVSGLAAFKASWLQTNDMEAVVPFTSDSDTHFFIPFDNRNGYVTSVAIANPYYDASVGIAVLFRNPDGTSILLDSISLGPSQHIAFETTNRYPTTAGKNGLIEFTVGNNLSASALGLLFNDARHSFTSVHSVSIDPNYVAPK